MRGELVGQAAAGRSGNDVAPADIDCSASVRSPLGRDRFRDHLRSHDAPTYFAARWKGDDFIAGMEPPSTVPA
jgi:hypothetical protein